MTLYLLWAAGERLVAESLEELAEIYECAIDAGDAIERLRAVECDGRARRLSEREFGRLLELAYPAYARDARHPTARHPTGEE